MPRQDLLLSRPDTRREYDPLLVPKNFLRARDHREEYGEPAQYLHCMSSPGSAGGYDRVRERCRGVALARHFREAEGLSIAQIAERLGRSPATIKAYFYDPTGEKARVVKRR